MNIEICIELICEDNVAFFYSVLIYWAYRSSGTQTAVPCNSKLLPTAPISTDPS